MPVITAVAADLVGSCGRGTHRVKVDAALLPNFTRGNARADDLVRNNGYAANAIQLHQDHIVGSFFRLSHRPSWRYLGIGEEEARAFSREVEAAWKEFAEDDCCCIDVERKRTFTMMIREGVAMHAFNGELFVQATGYQFVAAFPDTVPDGQPEAHQQPEQYRRQPELPCRCAA